MPSKKSSNSNLSSSQSHSPTFGSPASEHGRRSIKTVGRDQPSDADIEHPESDQDGLEENQQQRWQIDYENNVPSQVELEAETDTARKQPRTSSWTGKIYPLFSMAGPAGSKEQGMYPGGVSSSINPPLRIKDHAIHPLSPVPASPGSGTSTPKLQQSRSPEIPPQKILFSSDLPSNFDINSIPPITASAVNQPLPPLPLPPPPTALPDQPRNRSKYIRTPESSRKVLRSDRPPIRPAPPFVEKKPVSLSNPPRKFVHHGKVLQVINNSTFKERYLFLFSDLLLIVKHMSDGHPTLDSRFQVKNVIELKMISLSLTRDKYDPKNGAAGAHSNRKISPKLVEFIHTFDHDPEAALKTYMKKQELDRNEFMGHLLFKTPELSKSQLALFLSTPVNKSVYRGFLDQCRFTGVLLDEALRTLLSRLSLPERASAQYTGGPSDRTFNRVDYLLNEFAKRWCKVNDNSAVFDAPIAHKLVIAMIVLNAQLHNNEGASLVKDQEEVGILVRPRVSSQPSTPTISSIAVMDSNLVVPLASSAQLYMTMELDDLSAFPNPTKESFVEMFQHLDQQRIVPKDTLHNIFLSISHQPLDIDSEKIGPNTANADSTGPAARKPLPLMISPSILPSRLVVKTASDTITITIPAPNPHFSIHLGGRDLKCEPPVLEFGSQRNQRFKITGLTCGKKTLTIQPKVTSEKGTPEQYYDLQNLPSKHTIAIEKQFMKYTFQISLLNDLGRRRRYLFGTSSGGERDDWTRALTECLHMVKGQNAVRLNQHTGLEQSIGLQVLKDILLGVEASDDDEAAPSQTNGPPEPSPVPIPPEGLPGKGASSRSTVSSNCGTIATTSGHPSPAMGAGVSTEWSRAHNNNNSSNSTNNNASNNASSTSPKDSWMCRMPKRGAIVPDRQGQELIKLVEHNSLMALMLGFMGNLGRDQRRHSEAIRRSEREEAERRAAAEAETETDEEYEDEEGQYDLDEEDEEAEDEEETMFERVRPGLNGRKNTMSSVEAAPVPTLFAPIEINVEHVPDTMARFSAVLRSPLVMGKKGTGDDTTRRNVGAPHEIQVPKQEQKQEQKQKQELMDSPVSAGPAEDSGEDGVVSVISGRGRKVKGKETWWTK
ncbi:hypothetical protein BGZ65_004061 [Modicella reniformis]|uniref:SEC7 domain-containing protein n=1 Tax=Modicella reniformis TaxID=1440133 RepID=A0A9P6MHM2_9FUNG|nr:hypothetical protein BGZ65_004061 [Modicella reniformis]